MSSCSRHSRSTITPRNVIILVVCIEVATTFAFTWPVPSIRWHSPASKTGPTYPSSGSTEVIACTYTDDRRTGAHVRCGRGMACLVVGGYCYPVSIVDPLRMGRGVRGHNTAMLNHGAPSRRPQETCSYKINRRGVREFTETALTAIKVPDDDLLVNARDQALVEGGDGVLGQEVDATYDYASSPNEKSPSPRRGLEYWGYRAIPLAVAAIWGTNFPVVKFVENHAAVPDATAAFTRFAIAAGAVLPFADWREREVLFAGMRIGVWASIGYITQAIGLQTSDASVCAFLCSLTVVFVPLITIYSKGIRLVTMVSSLLALLGTGLLELGDAHSSWNDLWCVAQAFAFAVAFTRIEYNMEKYPGKSVQLSIGQMLSVAGIMALWCASSCGGQLPDFSFLKDSSIAAALVYTGLITTSLAIWLTTVALEHVPAAEMSVMFSTEPLWATLVSMALLGERVGPNGAIGAMFILLACLTAQSESILDLMESYGGDKRKNNDKTVNHEGIVEGDDGGPVGATVPLYVLDELD